MRHDGCVRIIRVILMMTETSAMVMMTETLAMAMMTLRHQNGRSAAAARRERRASSSFV